MTCFQTSRRNLLGRIYNKDDGSVYVEAEVEDAVQSCPATQYEPEQWTSGRCSTTIIWDVDDPTFGPLSKEVLKQHFNDTETTDWTFIPFDNSEDVATSPTSPYRTVFGYWN